MVYRMRQWLEWVFTGDQAVSEERTVPALLKAFPEAADLTFLDFSYWTALVSICHLYSSPPLPPLLMQQCRHSRSCTLHPTGLLWGASAPLQKVPRAYTSGVMRDYSGHCTYCRATA